MIAYITLGGILGTLARYLMQGAIQPRGGTFPAGTLAINIAGSFLLGFIMRSPPAPRSSPRTCAAA